MPPRSCTPFHPRFRAWRSRLGLAAATVAAITLLLGACGQTRKTHMCPPGTAAAPTPATPAGDETARELPGLHNIVVFGDGLVSASVPEGDAGFDSVQSLDVRTIISVDGSVPDVARAQARGMRYVHLPFGYDGPGESMRLRLARAVRDLPGPVLIHCHHGQHRSASAAACAMVTLGRATPDAMEQKMTLAQTSPSYRGLWKALRDARPASAQELDAADANWVSVERPRGLTQSMLEIDDAHEHLALIARAGWTTPKDHPDLVPASEAASVYEALRHIGESGSAGTCDGYRVGRHTNDPVLKFGPFLSDAQARAKELEDAIVAGEGTPGLDTRLTNLTASCTACHSAHRD